MVGSARRRLAVVAALAVLPWVVVIRGAYVTVIGSVGYLGVPSLNVVAIVTYVQNTGGSPPEYMLAWAASLAVYVVAVASAAAGLYDHEDPRLTGGLLVVLGLSLLSVAMGFGQRPTYLAVPVGTILAWAIAWWYYWPPVRAMLAGTTPE
jgi:uncharacterized protein (TIGR04206 family)